MKSLGERIREIREGQDLSLREFVKKTGIGQFRGENTGDEALHQLCDFADLLLGYLSFHFRARENRPIANNSFCREEDYHNGTGMAGGDCRCRS
jgi:transcriptional regulator with XRE-family HTH domain